MSLHTDLSPSAEEQEKFEKTIIELASKSLEESENNPKSYFKNPDNAVKVIEKILDEANESYGIKFNRKNN